MYVYFVLHSINSHFELRVCVQVSTYFVDKNSCGDGPSVVEDGTLPLGALRVSLGRQIFMPIIVLNRRYRPLQPHPPSFIPASCTIFLSTVYFLITYHIHLFLLC